MVFLHFPSNFTDEEVNLQAKYMKLRKKKKQLLEFTKPKAEPEKSNPLKRSLDPKEATELAKKLVAQGKISVGLGKGNEQKTIFKRPSGLEKKLTESKVPAAIATKLPNYSTNTPPSTSFSNPNANTSSSSSLSNTSTSTSSAGNTSGSAPGASDIGYTPFTSSNFNSNTKKFKQTAIVTPIRKVDQQASEPATTSPTDTPDEPQPGPSTAIASTSSTTFGGPTSRGGLGRGGGRGLGYNRYEANNGPKPGHTVHVKATGGHRKFTEEMCREIFSKVGGTIVNITMELERNCGFVTFDKIELAEKSIMELDKSYHRDNMMLSVSFARRQPPLSDLCNDPAPSVFWTHLATNQSQKSSHQDKRAQIVYPEGEDFI
jgi:hypothetical protein